MMTQWALVALTAVVIVVGALELRLGLAWIVAFAALAGFVPVRSWAYRAIARRAQRRVTRLSEARRWEDARTLLGELREIYARTPAAIEQLRMREATTFLLEGRFAEAARLYESIDRARLAPAHVPWLLNNLAWAHVRSGNGPRAVEIARGSLDASAALPNDAPLGDLRACQLGTLGAALSLTGELDDAVSLLEQALARGGSPRQQAARELYLGEALHKLDRHDEARAAWKRAVDAAPDDDLAKHAREKLDHAPPPYR